VQVCHCSICRRLQGASFGVLASFWSAETLRVTRGEDALREYLSPQKFSRMFCGECGSRVFLKFDKSGLPIRSVAIYPTLLEAVREAGSLPQELMPQRHIFYADRLYDIVDGRPKFKDMPSEFGGSGIRLDDHGAPVA
jgi:hypothetical protein